MKLFFCEIILFFVFFMCFNSKSNILGMSYTCNFLHKSNIENEVYIYFSNLLINKKIMLIAVSNPYHNYKLLCKMFFSNYISICNITIKKTNHTFGQNKNINLTYTAIYIKILTEIPKAIKINNNIIPLLIYKPLLKFNIILAIVNFFQIIHYKQVVDVIEISKLYGVEHIVIYVTSSTLFIKSILYHYLKNKYVELVPFCFNTEINNVHETGQIEKINDVLYRYMYNTKYIIFNDIDEIILPIKIRNYIKLLQNIDNQSSDMYLFKSKLFPYFSNNDESIITSKRSCVIRRGREKFIIGNLYKYDILSVHIYVKSFFPIKINVINETLGYVRHTRFRGTMCKTNLIDGSLDYLKNYLTNIYKNFKKKFFYNSKIYYYGK